MGKSDSKKKTSKKTVRSKKKIIVQAEKQNAADTGTVKVEKDVKPDKTGGVEAEMPLSKSGDTVLLVDLTEDVPALKISKKSSGIDVAVLEDQQQRQEVKKGRAGKIDPARVDVSALEVRYQKGYR